MLSKAKDRRIAAALAFAGILLPGLHKFYLGQARWGIVYLLLYWTPVSRIASAIEGMWYLFQDREEFEHNFNPGFASGLSHSRVTNGPPLASPLPSPPLELTQIGMVAEALRQIEQLRQDGLISEYEFEQKRRQLLDRMG
jgi:TM2 domain-containing membrane protein YozV